LKSGGNAYDAALAGWLVSCLAEPVLTSLGGGGFAMVSPESGPVRLYDFFTQTPVTNNAEAKSFPLEADFGSTRQVFHLGAGSIATPGCVAGILNIHQDLGRLPLKECAAPAQDLCRSGLKITSHAAELLNVVSALYKSTAQTRQLFESKRENGSCLKEGETFHNPDLGPILDMLINEGSRWFYQGDISRMAADYCRDHGGHLGREDFLGYRVHVRKPLEIRRNSSSIWLNPPPSMGGTLIAIGLSLHEPATAASYPFTKLADWQQWIEPLRVMSLMRTRDGLDSLTLAEKDRLEATIKADQDLAQAVNTVFPHALAQSRAQGTTQLSIMDKWGNEISMTTSNGAGSAVILPQTGFMFNNMLGEEDLQPEGIGTWKPDTRLASMMAPVLARLADGTRVATGSGGSNRIRSTLLQILRHLLDRGVSLEEAVEAPRLHWENMELHAETEALAALNPLADILGWPVIAHSVPNLFFGGAHSVARLKSGEMQGIGDPRRGGICIRL
jgi:gamma-glutamyltranspeptidase/glutathione hydrolase